MDSLDTCVAYKDALSLYERYITRKLTMVTNYCLSSSRMSRAYILRAFTPDQLLYLGLGRSASTGDRVFSVLSALILFESPHIDHTLDPSDVPTWLMMFFKASRSDLDSIIRGLKELQHGFIKLPEYLIEAFEIVEPSDVPNYEPPKSMVCDEAVMNSQTVITVKKYFMDFFEQCVMEALRYAVSNCICSQKIILRELRPVIMSFLMYLVGLSRKHAKLCLLPIGVMIEINELLSEVEIFEARDIAMFIVTYLHSTDDLVKSSHSFHSRLTEEIGQFPEYFEDVLRIIRDLKGINQEEPEIACTSVDKQFSVVAEDPPMPTDETCKEAEVNIGSTQAEEQISEVGENSPLSNKKSRKMIDSDSTQVDEQISAVTENSPKPASKKSKKLRISANALAKVLEKYTRDGSDKKRITIPADEVEKLLKNGAVSPQVQFQGDSENFESCKSLQTSSTPLTKNELKTRCDKVSSSDQVDSTCCSVSPDLLQPCNGGKIPHHKSTSWQTKEPRVVLHRLDLETYEKYKVDLQSSTNSLSVKFKEKTEIKLKISTVENLSQIHGSVVTVPGSSELQKKSFRSSPGPRSKTRPQRKPSAQPLLPNDKDCLGNNCASKDSVSLLQSRLSFNSPKKSAAKVTNDERSLLLEPIPGPTNARRCSPRRPRFGLNAKICSISQNTHKAITEAPETEAVAFTADRSQKCIEKKCSELNNLNDKTTGKNMPSVQMPGAIPRPLNVHPKIPRSTGPTSKTQSIDNSVLSNDFTDIDNTNSRLELNPLKEVKKTTLESRPQTQVAGPSTQKTVATDLLTVCNKSPQKSQLCSRSKTNPLGKSGIPLVLSDGRGTTGTDNSKGHSSPAIEQKSTKVIKKVTNVRNLLHRESTAANTSNVRKSSPCKSQPGPKNEACIKKSALSSLTPEDREIQTFASTTVSTYNCQNNNSQDLNLLNESSEKISTDGLHHSHVESTPGPSNIHQRTTRKPRIVSKNKNNQLVQKPSSPLQIPKNKESSGTNALIGDFASILKSRLTSASSTEDVKKVAKTWKPSGLGSVTALSNTQKCSNKKSQTDLKNKSNCRSKTPPPLMLDGQEMEFSPTTSDKTECLPVSKSSEIKTINEGNEKMKDLHEQAQKLPEKAPHTAEDVEKLLAVLINGEDPEVPPKARLKNGKIPAGKKLEFTEDKNTSNEPRSKLQGTELPPKKAYLSSVSFNKTHPPDNDTAEDSQNISNTLTPSKEGINLCSIPNSASRPESPCDPDLNLSNNQSEEGTVEEPELMKIDHRGLHVNATNQSTEEKCLVPVEPLQSTSLIKQPVDHPLEQVNSADSEHPKKNSQEAVLMLTSNGQLMTTEGEVLPFVVGGSYTVINEGADQVIYYSLEGMESAPEAERVADSIDIYESEVESIPSTSAALQVQAAQSSESEAAEPVYQYVPVGQHPAQISIPEDTNNKDSTTSPQVSLHIVEILDDVETPDANPKRPAVNNPSYTPAKKLKTREFTVKKGESKDDEKQVRFRGRMNKKNKELEPWACGHLERRILANQRLISACREGDFSAVKMWLSNGGASVNTVDRTNMMQPLHWFAQFGNVTAVCFLLDRGAFLEAKGPFSMTALHLAVSKGHFEMARALVERGANLEAVDDFGETPLHLAAYRGHTKLARFLLVKGANVYHLDKDGKDCLISAKLKGHIETVNIILEYLSQINHPSVS